MEKNPYTIQIKNRTKLLFNMPGVIFFSDLLNDLQKSLKTIEWLLSQMETSIESGLLQGVAATGCGLHLIRTHLSTAIQSHSKVLFLYTFLLVQKIFSLQ